MAPTAETPRFLSVTRSLYLTTGYGDTRDIVIKHGTCIFLDYPPRQEPGSFNVDNIISTLEAARAGSK